MVFSRWELLTCWSCFISLTLWIDLPLLSGLQFICYLQTALKWLVFPHFLNVLQYAGHCLCGCPVPHYRWHPLDLDPKNICENLSGLSDIWLIWPNVNCQTEVGGHIVYDVIRKTSWCRRLWPNSEQRLLTFPCLYHHTFIQRFCRNHFIKFWGKLTLPELKKWQFSMPVKLATILSMMSL